MKRIPNPKIMWGLYNGCRLFNVCDTKKACKEEAEMLTGVPWEECKKYLSIYKVSVHVVDVFP